MHSIHTPALPPIYSLSVCVIKVLHIYESHAHTHSLNGLPCDASINRLNETARQREREREGGRRESELCLPANFNGV